MSTTIEHYKPWNRTHYVAWCQVVDTLMAVGEGDNGDIEEPGIEWADRVIRELAEDAKRWRTLAASMQSGVYCSPGTSAGERD